MLLLDSKELREGDVILVNKMDLARKYDYIPNIPPLMIISDGDVVFPSWFFENRLTLGWYRTFCKFYYKPCLNFELSENVHIIAVKRFNSHEEIKEYFKDRPAFKDIKWDWEMRYDNRYTMLDTVKKDMQHYWEDDSPCW